MIVPAKLLDFGDAALVRWNEDRSAGTRRGCFDINTTPDYNNLV